MSRPKRVFSVEQEEEIVRRYSTKDESISAIAEILGATRPVITSILTKHGVTTRHHQHALTPSQEADVVRRFENEESYVSMEKIFGTDRKTISAIIRRRGGPLRRCGKKRSFESREDWLRNPRIRLRKLLHTARATVRLDGRGLEFDDALFDIFPENPPKTCACCGVVLDYNVYPRNDVAREKSPSIDRCINSVGYVVGNVYVTCFRCNRLKNNATLEDLKLFVAYVERHLKSR